MQQPRIWLVEDEQSIADTLVYMLQQEGFQVSVFGRGLPALEAAAHQAPDVAILDVGLPDISGFELCRRLLTRYPALPVLFLTARSDEVDKLLGLEIGADDYIPKPFNPRELLARIRAVLRRQANELPGAPSQEEAVIAFGKFKLNLGTREMFREDEPMPLTSGEFAVLKALVSHPREPLSRDKLMNLARGREYSAMERSIDVQISRLRRMVEEDPAHPRYIQTVWGLGYVFVPDGSKA